MCDTRNTASATGGKGPGRIPEGAEFNRIKEAYDIPDAPARYRLDSIEDLRKATTYQTPDAEQMKAHLNVRAAAQAYLEAILVNVPHSSDREQAVQSVRVSLFFSNAAIALRGRV